VIQSIASERSRVWAIAMALIISGAGACAVALDDAMHEHFETAEILLPAFAGVCLAMAIRALEARRAHRPNRSWVPGQKLDGDLTARASAMP